MKTCLEGIFKAQEAGFKNTKLDTVVIRNINDQEINDLLRFSIENDFNLRFIEYMDVGGALDWEANKKRPKNPIQSVEVDIVPLSEAQHMMRPKQENNVIPF